MSIVFYSIYNFIIRFLRKYINPTIGKILFIVGFHPKSGGTMTSWGVEVECCGYFHVNDGNYYCGSYLFPIPKKWYIKYAKYKYPNEVYA